MSGYTRIPNEILESMFTEMNATEQAMCAYLCRYTYGMKNRSEFKVTKSDFIKAGIGSKPSIYKNWDSEILARFFQKDGSLWVTKVYLSGKDEVKKVYPKGKESLPQGYQKFTLEGKESLPSTSGLKKKENIKDNLKESDTPAIDFDPLPRKWAMSADIQDAIRSNQTLWRSIVSEIKDTDSRSKRFPEFLEKHPAAKAEDITFWVETDWRKNSLSQNGTVKPAMGNLINDFKPAPSQNEMISTKTIYDFLAGRVQPNELPFWAIEAYKASGIKRSGLRESELNYSVQEVLKHANAVTAAI